MHSKAETVAAYLDELAPDRRAALEAVREMILSNLPTGYEEAMNWGIITYQLPLAIYPDTYNGQPLMVAALAAQKQHMAVYLTGIYADEEARQKFAESYKATGKRMDMGKACVRFRKLDDLPLDLIGRSIAALSPRRFIQVYEQSRARPREGTRPVGPVSQSLGSKRSSAPRYGK